MIRIVKLTEALSTGADFDSFFGDGQFIAPKLKKRPRLEGWGTPSPLAAAARACRRRPAAVPGRRMPPCLTPPWRRRNWTWICPSWAVPGSARPSPAGPDALLHARPVKYTDRLRHGDAPEEALQRWVFRRHRSVCVLINLGASDASAIFCMAEDGKPDAPGVEALEAEKAVKAAGKYTDTITGGLDIPFACIREPNASPSRQKPVFHALQALIAEMSIHSIFPAREGMAWVISQSVRPAHCRSGPVIFGELYTSGVRSFLRTSGSSFLHVYEEGQIIIFRRPARAPQLRRILWRLRRFIHITLDFCEYREA